RRRRDQAARSLERVEEELLQPSRADRYERFGHLLMAQPHLVEAASEVARLPDLLGDGSPVSIPLDPKLTPIENAQRMYGKAKANRAAREAALDRLDGLRAQLAELDAMLEEARALEDMKAVQGFEQRHAAQLARLRQSSEDEEGIPYRRFDVGEGYEVWVGRNAKQNDTLTLHDARPFDLWLHARGVAGSHAVLRVKGRQDSPPKRVIERAAAIAAWFSKARTHSLAPVIVTQRKYVRKPRKALPGAVLVEREQVIMIEPGLPVDKPS
ncbi:MAG: NFACT RNA binding domain-containing protein, partial [Bacteroidetes bacterium]|nr:NFACT RNA binding domain-containing protein [Bacteroidota bacterium]